MTTTATQSDVDTGTTLATVTRRMDDIAPTYTLDQIQQAISDLDYWKECVRTAESAMKDRVREWMETNEVKEFSIGPVRYFLATEKDTKNDDLIGTIKAVFLSHGHDLDAIGISVDEIALYLSKNAFKVAACKKLLPPDKFAELFVTTEKTRLGTEGSRKILQKVDDRFVK